MPLYDYYCEHCKREVTLAMSMSEHDKHAALCPHCGGKEMQPLVGTFFAKTSRKS